MEAKKLYVRVERRKKTRELEVDEVRVRDSVYKSCRRERGKIIHGHNRLIYCNKTNFRSWKFWG